MGSFSVGGLATGLDTKAIIGQLMQIEGRPKTMLEWKSQLWTARKGAWSDLNSRLLRVQNAANALLKPETLTKPTTQYTATSADPTNLTTTVTGTPAPGTYAISVLQLARGETSTSTGTDAGVAADDVLTIANGSGSWDVALAAGDTHQNIVDKINATTGIGVSATLDASNNIVLTSVGTGTPSSFTVSSAGVAATALGFQETQAAQDASYTVGGVAYSSATNSGVEGPVPGLALTFLGLTDTTVTVAEDTVTTEEYEAWVSAAKTKIADFVKEYNSTLDVIHQRTQGESRVANPKTLAQYVQGPMARDVGFAQVGFDLRRLAGESVEGITSGPTMLSQIGITASFEIGGGGGNGKLVIDDSKLDAALRADPAQVQAVLAKSGGAGVSPDDGIARRISEQVSLLRVGGRVDTSLDGATARIKSTQDAIDRATDRLERRKLYYERMFSALESRIGAMQSQGQWLSGQLAALSGGG